MQAQPFTPDRSHIVLEFGLDGEVVNGLPINLVAPLLEAIGDVCGDVLEREGIPIDRGRTAEVVFNCTRDFGPVCFGNTEVLAEIEQGAYSTRWFTVIPCDGLQ